MGVNVLYHNNVLQSTKTVLFFRSIRKKIMAISSAFQNRIKDLTDEVTATQNIRKSSLPKRMGIDYSSLSNALEYGILPTPRIAMRMADYFHCSIPYLFGTSDDEYFEHSKEPHSFSERILLLCEERSVKYKDVCEHCGFYRGYLARWIKNNYIPSWDYLDDLAKFFDVSVDYLLGRTDDKK